MQIEECLTVAEAELRQARRLILDELRSYPTPISGCDAQYNHLISRRSSIDAALHALDSLPFVATPRTPSQHAGVESR